MINRHTLNSQDAIEQSVDSAVSIIIYGTSITHINSHITQITAHFLHFIQLTKSICYKNGRHRTAQHVALRTVLSFCMCMCIRQYRSEYK